MDAMMPTPRPELDVGLDDVGIERDMTMSGSTPDAANASSMRWRPVKPSS